jgi:hypothetical protein
VTSLLTTLLTLHLIGVATAQSAPQATSPAFKISGLVYADYYYVAANHRDEIVDRNGFWLRRVYLTYEHTLTQALSLRVRLEFVEGFLGYRSIEKTPVDLYGWDSSRDLGVALQGRLGAEQRTRSRWATDRGPGRRWIAAGQSARR